MFDLRDAPLAADRGHLTGSGRKRAQFGKFKNYALDPLEKAQSKN